MKVICLNIFGGKYFEPLIAFLQEQSRDTDFFCFQEVFDTASDKTNDASARVNIFSELKTILSDFVSYYVPVEDNFNYFTKQYVTYPLSVGMAMFVRKTIPVIAHDAPFISGAKNSLERTDFTTFPKVLQTIRYRYANEDYTIFNIHGPWTARFKGDNERTLSYFKKVRDILNTTNGKKILCGDFNVSPDTQSIALIEKGMRNLINEYRIPTTRSTLYQSHISPFADYVFVSPDVTVEHFSLANVAVSDHLPLVLQFS